MHDICSTVEQMKYECVKMWKQFLVGQIKCLSNVFLSLKPLS